MHKVKLELDIEADTFAIGCQRVERLYPGAMEFYRERGGSSEDISFDNQYIHKNYVLDTQPKYLAEFRFTDLNDATMFKLMFQ